MPKDRITSLMIAERIKEFVKDLEANDVRITGWDDEFAYFNWDGGSVRVGISYSDTTHTVEVEV